MDAKELGNQPAYPVPVGCGLRHGLTKREAAALAAMQGLLSTPTDDSFYSEDGQRAKTMDDNYRYCAKIACGYADALLAELAKGE